MSFRRSEILLMTGRLIGLVFVLMTSDVLSAITFTSVSDGYSKSEPPEGFADFSKAQGVPDPNTCAVRLSYALFKADRNFFKDVKAKSGIEWHGLIVRADDLAIILNKKIQKAALYVPADKKQGLPPVEINKKRGIIFFDKLEGWEEGTGHIALWDKTRVTDQKDGGTDFFKRAERIYFWPLK